MNFSSTNLGRIEKSNKSATSKQNGTNSEEAQKKKKNKIKNDALTRWLPTGFQKQDLSCVSVTMYFEVNNFRKT